MKYNCEKCKMEWLIHSIITSKFNEKKENNNEWYD